MRRIALALFFVALAACSVAFGHGSAPRTPGFRLPDASAACRLERGGLVCRSLGVRAGLELPRRGTPRAVRAPIWWDASTPVLHRFDDAGIRCRASGGAILCANAGGASISVGSRSIAVGL